MLSGTSTWLILTLISAFGIEYANGGIAIDPILREDEEAIEYTLNTGNGIYRINICKPRGFYRTRDGRAVFVLDGKALDSNTLPLLKDGREHSVEVRFSTPEAVL